MKNLIPIIALCLAASWATSMEAQQTTTQKLPPIRIILVGDSTVAPRNGWGPGCYALLEPHSTCLNMAKNGRSTSNYRAEGSWDQVLAELKRNSDFSATYVLIQFGHNDQPGKPGRSTDLATEFPQNLHHYVQEVKTAGAKPVLVTSLTRRSFHEGKLKDDLTPWAEATRKVAAEESVPVIDLYAKSYAAVLKMGASAANTLAMAPPPEFIAEAAKKGESPPAPKPAVQPVTEPNKASAQAVSTNNAIEPKSETPPVFDYTHLGEKGSAYFGNMVAHEFSTAIPGLQPYFRLSFSK